MCIIKKFYDSINTSYLEWWQIHKQNILRIAAYAILIINYSVIFNISLYCCAERIYLFGIIFIPPFLLGLFVLFMVMNRCLLRKIIDKTVISLSNWLLFLSIIYCLYLGLVVLNKRHEEMINSSTSTVTSSLFMQPPQKNFSSTLQLMNMSPKCLVTAK